MVNFRREHERSEYSVENKSVWQLKYYKMWSISETIYSFHDENIGVSF